MGVDCKYLLSFSRSRLMLLWYFVSQSFSLKSRLLCLIDVAVPLTKLADILTIYRTPFLSLCCLHYTGFAYLLSKGNVLEVLTFSSLPSNHSIRSSRILSVGYGQDQERLSALQPRKISLGLRPFSLHF